MNGEILFVTESAEGKPEITEPEALLCDLGSNLCALCDSSETP